MAGENRAEVSVKSELLKIVQDLQKIAEAQKEVGDGFKKLGNEVGQTTEEQTKRVQNQMDKIRGFGRRVADQLKTDFRSMLSISALGDSIKLTEQFKGSVRETVSLSDTIRKLGGVFKVARSNFSGFQKDMTKGLGAIGLSSEVAARAMEGLAGSGTPIAGAASVQGYASTAGMLSSATKQQGREGDVAKLLAQTIQARGGDVNDMKQLSSLAEDVRRVFNATGTGATDTLNAMRNLFAKMPEDLRKTFSSRGMAGLFASSAAAGPNSTKFLEEYLGASPIARMAMDAQGFKGVISDKGIDTEKFGKASKGVLGRIGMDPRKAAQTLGLSEEAAEGFIRLSQSLDRVKEAQAGVQSTSGSLTEQYKQSRTLSESFGASINRIKGLISGPLEALTQGGTEALSRASDSDMGAAGVVAGGATLAAMLAGFGLRGVGRGLGGVAGAAAVETATGRQVQPVYVTNASEISSGGLLGGAGAAAGGVGTTMKAGAVAAGTAAAAVGVGLAAGDVASYIGEGRAGADIDDLIEKMKEFFTGKQKAYTGPLPALPGQTVKVELNKKELKESPRPGRGGSH